MEKPLGKEVKLFYRSNDDDEWKEAILFDIPDYVWKSEGQKKKTISLVKRLAARAIIYAAIHN